jgi:superfamily I DNA/RNA helicase
MQARVDVNVPFGHSDCHIRTFHAFAADLLQQFAVDIQLSRAFSVFSVFVFFILFLDQ